MDQIRYCGSRNKKIAPNTEKKSEECQRLLKQKKWLQTIKGVKTIN